MNKNVRKVFDILGIEPNEEFKIDGIERPTFYYIDEELNVYDIRDDICLYLRELLTGEYKIIKLPKEPKKKKLRDLTPKEWNKWQDKNCVNCNKCVFENAVCFGSPAKNSWVYNKDFYSDKFLNQEIEVE